MSWLRRDGGLIIILTTFLALGALFLHSTPLLETPDEPSHFSVIQYIADEKRLPPAQTTPAGAGPVPVIQAGPPVYYAPPLYYLLGAVLIADVNTDGFAQAVIPNPNWARGWAPTPGRSPDNKHIYVHTADQRHPLAGWASAMYRLRIFSLLLGGVTVLGVYALARMMWPDSSTPAKSMVNQYWTLATTALVAFNPAYLFVTIGVTNDALVIALSTWAFVLMTRLVTRSEADQVKSVVLLGVLAGLGALTKQSFLIFAPIIALVVVWTAQSRSSPRGTILKWVAVSVGLIAVIGGWWYLYNMLAYSDPLGFQPHQTPGGDWTPTLSLLLRQLGQALQGYWGAFGWSLILVDPIVNIILLAFVLVGLSGWLRRLRAVKGSQCLANGRVVAILSLGIGLNLAGLVLWLWRTSAPYGRLLFPTLGPLAVILAMGWQHWFGLRFNRAGACVIILGSALYAAIVPGRYLQPAYASPIVSPFALDDATPLDVQFDASTVTPESENSQLHLLGYQISRQTAKPGDRVTLTLYWKASAHVALPLTVFAQVAPSDVQKRVAGLDDFLGSSRYPTPVWQPDDLIRQVHHFRLPDDTPAPVVYWFTVGLYQAKEIQRIPVTADGNLLPDSAVRLGPLAITNRSHPQPNQALDYQIGSTIRLIGYDMDLSSRQLSSLSQTDVLTVTLYWHAVAAPEQDLQVFVHLYDENELRVAQHDGPPRDGDFPTWIWQQGDLVPDAHALVLPPDHAAGPFHLLIGLYRPKDGARLPVYDHAGQRTPNDTVVLNDIYLLEESDPSGN